MINIFKTFHPVTVLSTGKSVDFFLQTISSLSLEKIWTDGVALKTNLIKKCRSVVG